MSELIDKQDAIDAMCEACVSDGSLCSGSCPTKDAVGAVSPAEPKTGKWIKMPEFCGDDVSGFVDNHFSCSECKKEAEINSWGFYILSDFCPNCGADMRKEESEEDYDYERAVDQMEHDILYEPTYNPEDGSM